MVVGGGGGGPKIRNKKSHHKDGNILVATLGPPYLWRLPCNLVYGKMRYNMIRG